MIIANKEHKKIYNLKIDIFLWPSLTKWHANQNFLRKCIFLMIFLGMLTFLDSISICWFVMSVLVFFGVDTTSRASVMDERRDVYNAPKMH